ncbi:hypothetical protein SISNIDRAFT_461908 [Sistotremastrum niveocremeum HHB9708]|uniref:Uncharacterized protein n=1 Tax=Sistotremastrum niveocremeum HHB9708 TaxID=1314777 RepID=A0A165AGT6_9AGAM|nr:hypothetical protein SISNIDRAFT_461908 [Sistotremastrum niveocremeum HHB9708]
MTITPSALSLSSPSDSLSSLGFVVLTRNNSHSSAADVLSEPESSDDEIVWHARGHGMPSPPATPSEDEEDFIVLTSSIAASVQSLSSVSSSQLSTESEDEDNQPTPHLTTTIRLANSLAQLSLDPAEPPTPVQPVAPVPPAMPVNPTLAPNLPTNATGGLSKSARKKAARRAAELQSEKNSNEQARGLGRRLIVDDDSDAGDEQSEYQKAVKYMTEFIANAPTEPTSEQRLAVMKALILELGILPETSAQPTTVTAAKKLLKSKAFINIRDYLARRNQGQQALRQVMHPSRKSLIKDITVKHRAMSLKEAKKKGLHSLLVTCFL